MQAGGWNNKDFPKPNQTPNQTATDGCIGSLQQFDSEISEHNPRGTIQKISVIA